MSGAEMYKLLEGACKDAGLDDRLTSHVMLCFSVRWGQSIIDDIDMALFAGEMKDKGNGD